MSHVTLIFTLSMPGVASWNGKWTGADRCYARTRRVKRATAEKIVGYHTYRWSDGWCAGVTVKESPNATETRKVARKSDGFYGYDWMIDSLIKHGAIYADHELPAATDKGTEVTE